MSALTHDELTETIKIIENQNNKISTKPYLAISFASSKIKKFGMLGFDPMFSFYEMPNGQHINRAGLTFKETVELKNEDLEKFNILRGKLMGAMFRVGQKPAKKARPIYEDELLAELDAKVDMYQEEFSEGGEKEIFVAQAANR